MTDSHDRFRQLPQALVAHLIQTYLTDASAFALIATDRETFHRYRPRYIMKSECTWLCLHHRSGDDPVKEWMFIHLRQPLDDAKFVTSSINEVTDWKNDRRLKLPDDPEPTPFTQLPQLQANFSHSLSIGIMNPSRIKLREESLQANVDLVSFKLPLHLKCFPSPLPNTVKQLFLTPTTGSYEGRTGISITFYSRWSEFILPNRLEVIEFIEGRSSYFDEKVNWPSTLHTMVIKSCTQDYIIPKHPMYLPATLTDLTLSFDSSSWARDSLKHVQLPPDLKRLEYCSANSSPMPSSLLELVLGDNFNEPIIDWILPPNLTRLKFGNKFNQSLFGVNWPVSLTTVSGVVKTETPTTSRRSYKLKLDIDAAIRKQVEFYFSDSNLSTDKHLKAIYDSQDGWVPITEIASFKKMKALTTDLAAVIAALKPSTFLKLNEDETKVTRRVR